MVFYENESEPTSSTPVVRVGLPLWRSSRLLVDRSDLRRLILILALGRTATLTPYRLFLASGCISMIGHVYDRRAPLEPTACKASKPSGLDRTYD